MADGLGSLEDVVIDRAFWRGRRILLTGHTGFKGAWLALLLRALDAEVTGLALEPVTSDDLFVVARVEGDLRHRVGDVRDAGLVAQVVREARPDVLIHMAAQALVRRGYQDPVGTYASNVMGTVNVLEALRQTPGTQVAVVVTSDKSYENTGQPMGYRETDLLGGRDPYSSSKACAELVTECYRRSFLSAGGTAVAAARAGNVVGGGDWSTDRLVPDAMRAFSAGSVLRVRNPHAIRPWQHVLDPLLGYLILCQATAGRGPGEAWNFGPGPTSEVAVDLVIDGLARRWGGEARWEAVQGDHLHEAAVLKLDCGKASERLGWHPRIGFEETLDLVVEWYRARERGADMRRLTLDQISRVVDAVGAQPQ